MAITAAASSAWCADSTVFPRFDSYPVRRRGGCKGCFHQAPPQPAANLACMWHEIVQIRRRAWTFPVRSAGANSRGSSSPATHHHRTMAGLSPAAERSVEVIRTLQDWLKGLCGRSGGDTSGRHELPRRQGSTGRRERSGAPTSSSKNRSACRPGPGVTGRKLRTPDEPFHARPQRRA